MATCLSHMNKQLLDEWSKFLGAKFASPDADKYRSLECLTAEDDEFGDEELHKCLEALRCGKAPGCDNVPVEAYRGSVEATKDTVPHLPRHVVHRTYPAGPRAWHVCNASQGWATGQLQELPSNLPPVSLLQADVWQRGTPPDDYSGGPPT